MKKLINKQSGFTIVELLVSTVIFTLMLMAAMAAMVQIGRLYYKGIVTARTQEAARSVAAEITQSIQFSRDYIYADASTLASNSGPEVATGSTSDGTGFFCIGPRRYTYVIDRKLVSDTPNDLLRRETRHVMWIDTPLNGCAGNSSITKANMMMDDPCSAGDCINGREVFTENMRLTKLTLANSPSGSSVWNFTVGVAYGDDNTAEQKQGPITTVSGKRQCIGGSFVVQFCAISEISATAIRRL